MRRSIAFALFFVALVSVVPAHAASFAFAQWGSVGPAAGWNFAAGDFTNNGLMDVVGYHPNNGSIWVGRNTGAATFSFTQWASVSPAAGWSLWAGDFTGDGLVDIGAYYSGNGSIWVGRNTGASTFSWSQWASVSPASNWHFWAADFTGDGRVDIGGYYAGNGSVWVGTNTGVSSFSWAQWAMVSPASGWRFDAGDFTGDGKVDVVGYQPSNGSVWVGANTTAAFSFGLRNLLSPAAGWSLVPGAFSGAGTTDLAGYHNGNGSLWVGRNAVSSFYFQSWATVGPASGWSFTPGDFTGDGVPDLFGYYDGDGSLWVGENGGQPPEGYAWPLSAAPGETIDFFASGNALSTVEFFRHRSTDASVTSSSMGTTAYLPASHPLPDKPWANGCAWPVSFSYTIPANWPPGIYSARLQSAGGAADHHITFVVKPAPAQRSNVAVLANVNTWLAYNSWGGKGKYGGAALTSFLRPDPGASPVGQEFAHHHLARAELWILTWLEDEGYAPDVYTDIDFHNGLPSYDFLVLGTHPEYWSSQMYDNLEAFLAGGGKLLYLAANGIYEEGSYGAGQTQMTFFAGVEDGPREAAMFRNLPTPRHERTVLGVATERCSVPGSPFEVIQPQHFAFAGTGLGQAGTFGSFGYNIGGGSYNGMASAWEVDTSSGPGAIGMGCSGGTAPPSTLPAGLAVLARGQPTNGLGGEMTYYDHPGGGFVFAAGSLTFGGSLPADPAIQQILRNVLAH